MTRHKKRPLGCGNTTKGQGSQGLHENDDIIPRWKAKCKG